MNANLDLNGTKYKLYSYEVIHTKSGDPSANDKNGNLNPLTVSAAKVSVMFTSFDTPDIGALIEKTFIIDAKQSFTCSIESELGNKVGIIKFEGAHFFSAFEHASIKDTEEVGNNNAFHILELHIKAQKVTHYNKTIQFKENKSEA
jgi:hypothetical protein